MESPNLCYRHGTMDVVCRQCAADALLPTWLHCFWAQVAIVALLQLAYWHTEADVDGEYEIEAGTHWWKWYLDGWEGR